MNDCCFISYRDHEGQHKVSCDVVRSWKDRFKRHNFTDTLELAGIKDKAYEEYCQMVDHILKDCKCEDRIPLKCKVCKDEDHEGYLNSYCRCEGRNIELAKQHRRDGWKPDWSNVGKS